MPQLSGLTTKAKADEKPGNPAGSNGSAPSSRAESSSPIVDTITLDGHELRYSSVGPPDAQPLMMVHGWYSYRGVWRQTCETFKDSHYCIAMDLLGFGDSDKPHQADYSIAAQGERILRLADKLGCRRFALIGHSMGGQIALCVAAMLAPERVTKLVSVAGVVAGRLKPVVELLTYRQVVVGALFPWLYTLTRWLTRNRRYAYFHFRPWFYQMDAVPFAEWEMDRRMALQPEMYVAGIKAWQAMHSLNLTAHLPRVVAPTLVIFGKQDGTVPVSDGHLIEEHIAGSHLVLLDQCGHFPMYEQPRQYLGALQVFLLDHASEQ